MNELCHSGHAQCSSLTNILDSTANNSINNETEPLTGVHPDSLAPFTVASYLGESEVGIPIVSVSSDRESLNSVEITTSFTVIPSPDPLFMVFVAVYWVLTYLGTSDRPLPSKSSADVKLFVIMATSSPDLLKRSSILRRMCVTG